MYHSSLSQEDHWNTNTQIAHSITIKYLTRASRSNTGTDRMGKLILVRQTDSRQCFLTTQARRLSVDKVKKDEKTSLGNQASRFARMLKQKSEELARQKAKETCYNPSVLERAWELRTGDYINIKAEIVQEFGSDVFEDHKNVIKGLLQFLNISELCGAELVRGVVVFERGVREYYSLNVFQSFHFLMFQLRDSYR